MGDRSPYAIEEILVLPRAGRDAGNEVLDAKEILIGAGISVITIEYVEKAYGFLSVPAADCSPAIRLLTKRKLNVSLIH